MPETPKRPGLLVLTTYPPADASRRLRIDPLVSAAQDQGIPVHTDCLLPGWAFRRKNAGLAWRVLIAMAMAFSLTRRVALLVRMRPGQTVIVHREAFPFFTPLAERAIASRGVLILDVDDAIHQEPTHVRDWRRFARDASRVLEFLPECGLVLAGSPYMEDVARSSGAPLVRFTPTCPPPAAFNLATDRVRSRSLVWTGGHSTLHSLLEPLDEILRFCEDRDYFLHVVGAANIADLPDHPRINRTVWSESAEIQALRAARIGLMPLPSESSWEHGKSAYKALLYLASGLPAVVSPVGMNSWLANECSAVRVAAVDRWYETLNALASDDRQLDDLYDEAREWAVKNCSPSRVAARTLTELLAAGGDA